MNDINPWAHNENVSKEALTGVTVTRLQASILKQSNESGNTENKCSLTQDTE